MRHLARPGLLFRRRMKLLERQLPSAAEGDAEGVHQARVASRRLREVVPLLAGLAGEHAARTLRRDIRAITTTLGPLREIDVVLAMLTDLESDAAQHAPAIALVRARTTGERARLWPQVGRALAGIEIAHVSRRVAELATQLDTPSEKARCAVRSSVRLDARTLGLDEAVRSVGVVYAAGPLHEVRIALKKFRYALEIAAELGRLRLDASLSHLKSLQDLLGTMHDLQVLTSRVRDCEAATRSAGARRQLREFADELDQRVRQMHSRYLDERLAIVPVIGRARKAAVALRTLRSLPE